jgi:hypothetical protein
MLLSYQYQGIIDFSYYNKYNSLILFDDCLITSTFELFDAFLAVADQVIAIILVFHPLQVVFGVFQN